MLNPRCYLCTMRMASILLLILLSGKLPAQTDYRYYQSPVRSVEATHSQAAAVASLFEISLGGPSCVDLERLGKLVPDLKSDKPSPYLFSYSEILGNQGLEACGADGKGTSYKGTKGTIFHWSATQARSRQRVIALLERGQKAVVVNYLLPMAIWDRAGNKKSGELTPEKWLMVSTEGQSLPYQKALRKVKNLPDCIRQGSCRFQLQPKDSADMRLIGATIVGHDDEGFWVKGFGGPSWGIDGFIKVPFIIHEWACQEIMTVLMVEPIAGFKQGASHLHRFQLRTLPEYLEGKPYIQLFVVETGHLPVSPVTHLQYEVIPQTGSGLLPKVYKSLISDLTAQSGFPIMVPAGNHSNKFDVKLTYRCENGEMREVLFQGLSWKNAELSPR